MFHLSDWILKLWNSFQKKQEKREKKEIKLILSQSQQEFRNKNYLIYEEDRFADRFLGNSDFKE